MGERKQKRSFVIRKNGFLSVLSTAIVLIVSLLTSNSHAFVEHGVIFPITDVATDYNIVDNYYTSASDGVYFTLVAPTTGTYKVSYIGQSNSDHYFAKYTESTYSSKSYSFNLYGSNLTYNDTISLSAGDTAFFKVYPYYSDKKQGDFSIQYSILSSYTITISNASPKCFTSQTTFSIMENKLISITATSEEGFRPNGWEFKSGTYTIIDSAAHSITLKITSNTEIELQCTTAQYVDISTTQNAYTVKNNFYTTPNDGIRFRYIAPTTDLTAIRLSPMSLDGYAYFYGADSTFENPIESDYIYSTVVTHYYKPSAVGESYYFGVVPYSSSYYNQNIYAYVLRAALIEIENTTEKDTSVIGEITTINAPLAEGQNFVKWFIVSGTGSFGNTALKTTTFTPTSDHVVLGFQTKQGSTYALDENFQGFTYIGNGTKASSNYGIRTSFTASDEGNYTLIVKTRYSSYILNYLNDSDFGDSYTSYSCSSTQCKHLFNANENTTNYFLLKPYNDSYMSDSVWAKVVKNVKVRSDTAGYGYVYVGNNNRPYDSTATIGDTLVIKAFSNSGFRFDHWDVSSGTCSIPDSTKAISKVVIGGDCKVKAYFREGTIYAITDSAITYSTANNYYDYNATHGVRFSFTASETRSYIITFEGAYGSDLYFYKYRDANYSSQITRYNFYSRDNYIYRDTVDAKAGDQFYYTITNYNTSDSLRTFTVKYTTPKSYTVTTTSTAPQCSTGIETALVVEKRKITLHGYAQPGYRANGWEIISGSNFIKDSSAYTITDSITDDTHIELQCSEARLLDIDDTARTFVSNRDFYDQAPDSGMKFQYTAPSAGNYAVQVKLNSFRGYYEYFATDETFEDQLRNTYLNLNKTNFNFTVSNDGDHHYIRITPSNESFWAESISVRAARVSIVETAGRTQLDSIMIGDSLSILPIIPNGETFNHWSLVYGTGTFVDSTNWSTTLIPTSDSVYIAPITQSSQIYTLTDTYSNYTFQANGGKIGQYFGINGVFTAPDNGYYKMTIAYSNNYPISHIYTYNHNEALTSYNDYWSCSRDTCSITFNAKTDSAYYFTIAPNSDASLFDDTLQIKVAPTQLIRIAPEEHGDAFFYATDYDHDSTHVNGDSLQIFADVYSEYKFSHWEVTSGSCSIVDSLAYSTWMVVDGNCVLHPFYTKGTVYELSDTAKTFDLIHNYFSSYYSSYVRYYWEPTDTITHYLTIKLDSSTNTNSSYEFDLYDYGIDSIFTSYITYKYEYLKSNKLVYPVKGKPGQKQYFMVNVGNKDVRFIAQVEDPYKLTVTSTSQGRAYPSSDIYIISDIDTTIYAVPYAGYTFSQWTPINGNMTINNATNSSTRISIQSPECTVEASYVIDLTANPTLTITNLDLTNHPGICAQVSVTDVNNGRSFIGLDSSDFILFQDAQALPIQVTSIQEVTGISVVLVVDESGSMRDTRIQQAKASIRQFIDEMGPYDRTAIVTFSGSSKTTVKQKMTSNRDSLYNAVNSLVAEGLTNICDGVLTGLQQTLGETNPTTVIVFSDGLVEGGDATPESAIQRANSLGTPIYSIAIGGNYVDPLTQLATETGGTYTYAPTAAELGKIYSEIRSTVQAKYIICYQSPDSILDGDKHTVVINTNFLNKNASDTTYWNEDDLPPSVNLTDSTWNLVGVNQPQKESLTIGIYANSLYPIANVDLHVRSTGFSNNPYTSYSMVHIRDSLWEAIIPASKVTYPGIDFYVVATDSIGRVGKTPAVPNPATEPYTIPVLNEVPEITLLSKDDCYDISSGFATIRFKITDDDDIFNAKVYYKDPSAVIFSMNSMTNLRDTNHTWEAHIPASVFQQTGSVNFYVRAQDSTGGFARWQKSENATIIMCAFTPDTTTIDTIVPPDTVEIDTIVPPDTVEIDTIVPDPPKDTVYIAPDIKDTVTIASADSGFTEIKRETSEIKIYVTSQDFSKETDTIDVRLSCLVSGDVESNIKLIEKENGHFEMKSPIEKDEYSARKNNGTISCAATDTLVVEYRDPVYKTYTRDSVAIGDTVAYSYRFVKLDTLVDLDSVETTTSTDYRLLVTAKSKSIHNIDTVQVLLFTDSGDSLQVKAIETAPYSSTFEYIGSFQFVETSKDLQAQNLDAVRQFDENLIRIKIQAKTESDKSSLKSRDSLVVFANYVPADLAEIYDANLDGRADSIRIHFAEPLKKKITSIDTLYWNAAGGDSRKLSSKDLQISKDSLWITAHLKEPFGYGITAADSIKPYLKLTKDKGDFSQKVSLKEKIGAVPFTAVKHPGDIPLEEYLNASTDVQPDTLVITMSEPIFKKNNGKENSWKNLFRYASSCEDSVSYPVKTTNEPTVDSTGTIWTLILADYNIMVGNCIMTNPAAPYVDSLRNDLGRGGAEVEGKDNAIYLYRVEANPSVNGIGKDAKWIAPGGEKWEKVPDTLSTILISSIAPYKANITIYDAYAGVVTTMRREFGFKGEMEDPLRGNPENRSKIGFIEWNQRASNGRKVGTGMYIWQIDFKFKDGHSESRMVKTGVKRPSSKK